MAIVKGGKDGLVLDNTFTKKGEAIIDVDTLKNTYLFGLNITDQRSGEPLPDEVYQQYIDNAISMLEHYLDISISPVKNFIEYQDYNQNDYVNWGYFHLHNFPVIGIRSLKLVYFRDENNEPEIIQEIPNSWLRLQAHDGILRMVPNNRIPSRLMVNAGGTFFPEILQSSFCPHLWQFTYDYGFDTGCVPTLINQAIGLIAAMSALTVGGNLVLGAGIAGSSISLDGLSQSIQTTQSAENSAFSATIKEYGASLFGKNKDDPFALLKVLHNYYKGATLTIL